MSASLAHEIDPRCLSVREAVNFAKTTNLLGVILEATTLVNFFAPPVVDLPSSHKKLR